MGRYKIAVVVALLGLPLAAQTGNAGPPPPVVAKFLGSFDQFRAADAEKGKPSVPHIGFQLHDSEINDYLRYSLKATPRPGLESVTVKVFPNNYISTFTVVDFDRVERWKPGTIPTLLRPVLNGRKSIWVDCRFQADRSMVSFSVEKAYYESIRLPGFFVEKMIQVVAARQPEKYDTSKPLPIPFGLRQVWTTEHVIQGQN